MVAVIAMAMCTHFAGYWDCRAMPQPFPTEQMCLEMLDAYRSRTSNPNISYVCMKREKWDGWVRVPE